MAASTEWMRRNWRLTYVFAGVYLLLISVGQRVMAQRPR